MIIKFIILFLYIISVILLFIFIRKRLKLLNKRHIKHIDSSCLKKNYLIVMHFIVLLFIGMVVLTSFIIMTLL